MVLRPQLVHRTIWNLLDIAGTILQLQSTMEFHRQLLHQHHSQCHLHCGNDPTVANHNGIPSATHPPAPLAIPFTLRERSYSCKSQWNSVDRTCTKNTWNPIYNAEPIREWSENDPRMIRPWSENDPTTHETVSHPSHRRGRSSTFGDGLCMEKKQGFVHLLSLKNAFRARLPSKLHRQLIRQHHLQSHLHCGNDPTVANHNGILSTAHARKTLETPFTMRNRSENDPRMIREWSDHDPRMIRPHTRPSRTRRTAEVDHRRSGTDFVSKNKGFRASAISQKRISCETSFKTPSATHPPAPLAIPFTLRERSYSCKSQWNSVDRTCTKNTWNPIYTAEPIREWSDHDPRMIRPHTRPSRTRRTSEVDHRRSGTDFVWKNTGFRAQRWAPKLRQHITVKALNVDKKNLFWSYFWSYEGNLD